MEPAEAVLRFLAGVGPGSEAEFYLRLFRSRARESFAAIVFDPETWRESADGVALDLRLLATLSLTPVVVLGFYRPEQADGYANSLQQKLATMGVASRIFASDTSRDPIAAAAARGEIPLLTLHELDAELRERELQRALSSLGTHKLIFLRNEGGLTIDGRRLSVVNLSAAELPVPLADIDIKDELDVSLAMSQWSEDTKRLLHCSQRLMAALRPHELLVTLTSPLSLLHELFTVKGAGTLLRCGARILRHSELSSIDVPRLTLLLEDSFEKPLRAEVLQRPFVAAYIEEAYRGAALIVATPLGSYLSKFAVTRQAQGEGVGRDLWQALRAEHQRLFWRARRENPIRPWYEQQCDGRMRSGEWVVYGIGVEPSHFSDVIAYALAQPRDF